MKHQRASSTFACDRHVQVLALSYDQFIALTEIYEPIRYKVLASSHRRASTQGRQVGAQPSLRTRSNS